MAWNAAIIPDDADLLCESCGYTLKGLPLDGHCPECGKPIGESTGTHRRPPLWEQSADYPIFRRFFGTTLTLIVHPRRFYRTFQTRAPLQNAAGFARIHWTLISILFAITAFYHWDWYRTHILYRRPPSPLWMAPLLVASYLLIVVTIRLSARLTVIEASYRGYRLPLATVLRGMYYHSAHVLLVALVAAVTVLGYRWALRHDLLDATSSRAYLFVLCVEVVLGAAYLFETYWIAMRNMMYANR